MAKYRKVAPDVAPRARVSGVRLVCVVVGWLVGAAAVVAATRLVAHQKGGLDRPGDLAAVYMLEAYLILLAALGVGFGGTAGLRDRLGFRFSGWRDLALAPLVWIAVLVVGGGVTYLLRPLTGTGTPNTVRLFSSARDPGFLGITVATVVLLAPAAEEMLFRGALFGWLRGRIPLVVAAVVSAAIFAGAHLSLAAFVYLFVFGLAAAAVYQRTGSTLNSFLMHACQNALAVAVTLATLGVRGA